MSSHWRDTANSANLVGVWNFFKNAQVLFFLVITENRGITASWYLPCCLPIWWARLINFLAMHFSKELWVISKCANPNCCTPFRYLREGALFPFETNYNSEPPVGTQDIGIGPKRPRRFESFWLCARCSSSLVVRIVRGKVKVVPREDAANPAMNMHAEGVDFREESRVCELK